MSGKARLLSHSTVLFAARVFGAGLIFLIQAAIARAWGSAVLADYLVLIATINLAAMVMPLGFQTIGSYFAAEYRANGQRGLLMRFLLHGYGLIFAIASVFVVILGGVAAFGGAGIFPQGLWVPGLVLAVSTALVFVNGALLVGLKRPFAGFLVDGILRPLLIVLAFMFAMVVAEQASALSSMIWVFAGCYAVIAAYYCTVAIRAVLEVDSGQIDEREVADAHTRWWRFAMPWVMISIATDFFFDIDLLILNGLLDKPSVAVFGVCARIFALISFGVTAVYAVLLPDMFEAEARKDRSSFNRQLGDANLVASGLALAMSFGLLLVGPFVLLLFGHEFAQGGMALFLLSLVLVVRAVFGPASMVLSMHDYPWASIPAIAVGLVTLGALNFLLVPMWGVNGAAVSAVIAITVWSALLWYTSRRITGVDVSLLPRLKQFASRQSAAET